MAAALAYLQDNGLTEYEQLEKKAEQATEHFHTLAGKIKTVEAALATNTELKGATVNYAKTRPVFERTKRPGTAGNILQSMRRKLRFTGRRGQP